MILTSNRTKTPTTRVNNLETTLAGKSPASIRKRPGLRWRLGRVNLKLILILVGIIVVLGVGAYIARNVRRKILSERDFAAGNAAYDRGDWKKAASHFAEYLGRRPEDTEILGKFANSILSTEPLEGNSIARAIGAYRQLLRLAPNDSEACEELAELYTYLGQFGELAYIADRREEQNPDDPRIPIWRARALLSNRPSSDNSDKARKTLESLIGRLEKDDSGKHPQYVEACRILSRIELASQGNPAEAHAKAMAWMDLAIKYDPQSANALIHRAILRRNAPQSADDGAVEASQDDLLKAQSVKTDDPRIALTLSREWMQHRKLEQANSCLQSVRNVDAAVIKKHFIRANDWTVIRFLQAAELAVLRNKPTEADREAAEALEKIIDRRQRAVILPAMVRLCLAGERNSEARKHLNELLELRKLLQITRDKEQTDFLQASTALADGRLGEAVAHLEPLSVRENPPAAALALLARTYERIGMRSMAIRTAKKYVDRQERYPEQYPDESNMRSFLARQYAAAGDYASAAQIAAKAKSPNADSIQDDLLRIEMAIPTAARQSEPGKTSALEKLDGELAKLQESHPTNPRIRLLGGLLERVRKRPDAAEQRLKQAIKDSATSVDLELMLIRILAAQGEEKKAEALAAAIAACKRHPRSGQVWMILAGLHESTKDHTEAGAALRRGLEAVDPANAQDLRRALAILELMHGDREIGLKKLQDAAQQDPRDVVSRNMLLSAPEVRADTELAEQLLEDIRKVLGEGSRIWRRRRASLWLTNDKWRSNQSEAIEALSEWMVQDSETSSHALTLARLYMRLGKADLAERVCRKALELNPSATEAAEFLTSLLIRQQRYTDVDEVLDRLASPSRFLQRIAHVAKGENEALIRQLTVQVARNKSDVSTRILLARLVYQGGDTKQALAYLDQAAEISPNSPVIAWVRAAILKNDNKTDEARRFLDSLVKSADSFDAFHLRARFLKEIGELEAAEKDYVHLTTIEPRSQGYRILASFYRSTNQTDKAVDTLKEGLKNDSKNASLQFQLANLLIIRNGKDDLTLADRLLSSIENNSGKTADLLFSRALLTVAEGGADYAEKAQAILEELVKLEPAYVRAYLSLIQIAMARRDAAGVKAIALRGLQASPNHAELLLAQARAEIALKNTDAAAELARAILKNRPGYTSAVKLIASLAIRSKKPEAMSEALELARQAAKANPSDYRLPLNAAAILRTMKRPAEEVAELVNYTKTEAGQASVPILITLAEISRSTGKMDDWRGWIGKASKAAPESPAVLIERLRGLAAQGKHDEISSQMSVYRKGEEVNPLVLQTAGAILMSSESPEHRAEAVKCYERDLAANSESIVAQMNLALGAHHTGDLDRAEAVYRKILKTQPRRSQALNGLAWLLATDRGDCQEALPLINKAIEISPNNSHIYDTRGVIFTKLKRFADARKDFAKCLELIAPGSARRAKALLQLGRICRTLKDNSAARRHLAEALDVDTKNKNRALTDEQRAEIADILKKLPA